MVRFPLLGVGQSESQFILELLADLEARSPRFKSLTQIEELYSLEFEVRIKAVEAQILSVCPDFYSRWIKAVSKLGETLPVAVKLDKADDNLQGKSYLERWQKEISKQFKLVPNQVGKIMSTIGQFIGLEIINGESFARVIINGISCYC